MGTFLTIFSFDIKQSFAQYRTSCQYGAQKKEELLQMVLSNITDREMVLATPEFIYDLRVRKVPKTSFEIWQSAHTIYLNVKSLRPRVIITGLTTHTFKQLRDFRKHKKLNIILNKEYNFHKVGTYRVWFRKDDNTISEKI